jgi:hypothetical protein
LFPNCPSASFVFASLRCRFSLIAIVLVVATCFVSQPFPPRQKRCIGSRRSLGPLRSVFGLQHNFPIAVVSPAQQTTSELALQLGLVRSHVALAVLNADSL